MPGSTARIPLFKISFSDFVLTAFVASAMALSYFRKMPAEDRPDPGPAGI